MRITTVCLALAVAGCGAFQHTTTTEIDCTKIGLKEYTPEFEQKLVAEIKAAQTTDVWPEAIADYRLTREALQACQTAKAKN